MTLEFIAMLYFSKEHSAWLHLTGWDAPPLSRDALAALRQIERQTDEVIAQRGEPEFTPFLLLAGSLASERAPHAVRKAWRLAPELADRLLSQIEQRGAEEAIEEAIAELEDGSEDPDAGSGVDPDDYVGVDLDDLSARAWPAPS